MIAEIKRNEAQNGIEIFFKVYPLAQTRELLKSNGFRWNHKKSCWYAKVSDKAEEIAMSIAEISIENYKDLANGSGESVNEVKPKSKNSKDKKSVKKNKFGIKVGDVFHAMWGYDQTNNDFFQVIELVGEQSVRVIEVNPTLENVDAVCSMAEDRTFSFKNCTKANFSVFIKDQEKGDLKRIKGDASVPYFNLSSFADASLVTEDKLKVYESWYH